MREPSASSTPSGVELDDVGIDAHVRRRAARRVRRRHGADRPARRPRRRRPPRQSAAMPGSSARHAAPSSHSPSSVSSAVAVERRGRASRSACSRRCRSPSSSANAGQSSAERCASAVKPGVSGSGASTPAAAWVAPQPALPALEHADAQAALLRAPCRREADDPAADDRRVEPLHDGDDRVRRRGRHRHGAHGSPARGSISSSRRARTGEDPCRCSTRRSAAASTSSSCGTRSSRTTSSSRAAEPFRRACDAHGALFVLNDRPDLVERAAPTACTSGRATRRSPTRGASSAPTDRRPLGEHARRSSQRRARTTSASAPSSARRRSPRPRRAASSSCARRVTRARAVVRDRRHRARHGRRIVVGAGAPGVAVVRAIRDAHDPEAAARRFVPSCRRADASSRAPARRCGRCCRRSSWLERDAQPGKTGARPHTHARAHRRLLRPRGRARVPARRRDGARPGRLVRRGAAAARPRVPQSRATSLRATSTSTRPASGRAAGRRPAAASSYDTFGADAGSPDAAADRQRRPVTAIAWRRSTGSRS